jgi:hypothetical protein
MKPVDSYLVFSKEPEPVICLILHFKKQKEMEPAVLSGKKKKITHNLLCECRYYKTTSM